MQQVYDFLKQAQTYYLATVEDGCPRVRPFGTVDLFEGKLYIQTGLRKPVAQQMLQNPAVELCAMMGQQWIRIRARAVLDENIAAQAHMLEAYPNLKGMYQPGDGNTAVFYLTDACATISAFGAEPVEIRF